VRCGCWCCSCAILWLLLLRMLRTLHAACVAYAACAASAASAEYAALHGRLWVLASELLRAHDQVRAGLSQLWQTALPSPHAPNQHGLTGPYPWLLDSIHRGGDTGRQLWAEPRHCSAGGFDLCGGSSVAAGSPGGYEKLNDPLSEVPLVGGTVADRVGTPVRSACAGWLVAAVMVVVVRVVTCGGGRTAAAYAAAMLRLLLRMLRMLLRMPPCMLLCMLLRMMLHMPLRTLLLPLQLWTRRRVMCPGQLLRQRDCMQYTFFLRTWCTTRRSTQHARGGRLYAVDTGGPE
jgi:hypothetical protein